MALLLDLTQIRSPQEHVERVVPASRFDTSGDEFDVVGDIRLVFDIQKLDDRFRMIGRVAAELQLPCSRCLEPMPWPIDATFDLRYLPMRENAGEGEHEVAAEDLGVAFYEGESIDLSQLIREQFYLSIPMKPLCQPGCEGLCPECGANLNLNRCGCDHRWVDPRMAALGQLLARERKDDE